MATKTVENRIEVLESRIDDLQRLFEVQIEKTHQSNKRGWQAIVGTFENDPLHAEAMRLGRLWRETQIDEIE